MGKQNIGNKVKGATCLGEVLLALGSAVNDAAGGVFANVIHFLIISSSVSGGGGEGHTDQADQADQPDQQKKTAVALEWGLAERAGATDRIHAD
jgi:hypothetical protein